MRIWGLICLLFFSGWTVAAEPPSDPARVQTELRRYYFEAARSGDDEMIEEFVKAGFDLNVQDDKGYTGLILAAYHGHGELVDRLLAAGADPCAQDKRGNTALMGAIFKGELAIAKHLLDAGCAPDQRNASGQTAAMYAALFQREELLAALQARGADLQAHDAFGNSARSLAEGEIRTQPQP